MNRSLLPERDEDPHQGSKNVYACQVNEVDLTSNTRPFSDGAWLVKESIRDGANFPWLVATAEKRNGTWHWREYTRNFSSEPLLAIVASEATCIDCHRRVETADWIYTLFEPDTTEAHNRLN